MRGTFEVVAVALEPRERMERFAGYYLSQGASRVSIYFDRDERHDFADPRITFRPCCADFWRDLTGDKPESVELRQRAIYRMAYGQCEADWCLFVDLDEFVSGAMRLDRFFAQVPEESPSVRFETAEAVFGPGDEIAMAYGATHFRTPIARLAAPVLARVLYGPLASHYSRGLLGHSRGKQALRKGLKDPQIGIHDTVITGRRIGSFALSRAAGLWLAHYDAIDFSHWEDKFARRLARQDAHEMGVKRERQIARFAECSTLRDREDLFRRFYSLNGWQARLLKMLGLLHRDPHPTGENPAADHIARAGLSS
ncbi:glycosyltransferase family 2 protein [Tsuneonella mangrovi]|uniref:glycosyltransferase family 2 protein n=1 Tax=Tsuneonella mangrovi TaxID=1982042 RepID=UPI000BA20032|nr:hypothetical protein [Tsuneonella mangrovi]